jgi:hypothetical protein
MLVLFTVLTILVLAFPKTRAFAAQDQIPGMSDNGGPAMMPPMPGGNAAITALDGSVYVVQGNTLYRFDAKTLALQGKANLGTKPGRL